MSDNGKIMKHMVTKVIGHEVEIQVRKVQDGYRAEWSLDGGNKWNCLLKNYTHVNDALANAQTGAFIAQVHKNAVNRRKDSS